MAKVTTTLEHESPAYLDEIYVVSVVVRNDEMQSVQAFLDMQVSRDGIEGEGLFVSFLLTVCTDISTQIYETENRIFPAAPDSASSISSVDLGVINASSSATRKIYLCAKTIPGDRLLEYSVRFRYLSSPASSEDSFYSHSDSVKISFDLPFEVETKIEPLVRDPFDSESGVRTEQDQGGLLSPSMDFFESLPIAEYSVQFEFLIVFMVKCVGPWDVFIKESRFVNFPRGAEITAVAPTSQPPCIGLTMIFPLIFIQ